MPSIRGRAEARAFKSLSSFFPFFLRLLQLAATFSFIGKKLKKSIANAVKKKKEEERRTGEDKAGGKWPFPFLGR